MSSGENFIAGWFLIRSFGCTSKFSAKLRVFTLPYWEYQMDYTMISPRPSCRQVMWTDCIFDLRISPTLSINTVNMPLNMSFKRALRHDLRNGSSEVICCAAFTSRYPYNALMKWGSIWYAFPDKQSTE